MPPSPSSSPRNRILASLPQADLDAMRPHLETVELGLREVLVTPYRPIEHVWFGERGYQSVTTPASSGRVEVGMVGREGFVGVAVALGAHSAPFEIFVQHPGSALRMEAGVFVRLLETSAHLRRVVLLYAHLLQVQTASTARANADFVVEARLARWLLMCHDRLDGDDIVITHEFLAVMLGVRRAGITTATHILEGNGLIRARRGVITVLDRERLIDFADDAYGMPETEYERLMTLSEM